MNPFEHFFEFGFGRHLFPVVQMYVSYWKVQAIRVSSTASGVVDVDCRARIYVHAPQGIAWFLACVFLY